MYADGASCEGQRAGQGDRDSWSLRQNVEVMTVGCIGILVKTNVMVYDRNKNGMERHIRACSTSFKEMSHPSSSIKSKTT